MTPSRQLELAREALKPARLSVTGSPRVDDVAVDIGEDQSGDPALFATAFLAEDTKEEEWVSAKLDPIVDEMFRAIVAAGVDRYLYVRFLKKSDVQKVA